MVQSQHGHRPPLRAVFEAYVNVTASAYTAKTGDRVFGVNRAGVVTVTLTSAQLRLGRVYTVKDESGAAGSNNITVATEGSETIDGSVTDTISENCGAKTYYSNGSNWVTIPLLAVGSHTLASHSAKAHSDLTGVGAGDHHAQAHQADHNSGGADAVKLDDLAAPDDNTDLNFSTTAHGLVPKGTNVGDFLRDDGTWATPAGGSESDISARAYNSANISIANATWTTLTLDSERFDTATIHSTSSNTGRLTATTAGKYIIVGNARFASNATGQRMFRIYLNGTTEIGFLKLDATSSEITFMVATIYDLSATDYVELQSYQNSAGSLNVEAAANYSPEFMMAKVLG